MKNQYDYTDFQESRIAVRNNDEVKMLSLLNLIYPNNGFIGDCEYYFVSKETGLVVACDINEILKEKLKIVYVSYISLSLLSEKDKNIVVMNNGDEIIDCYMSGVGSMDNMGNKGIIEYVGIDYIIVRDLERNKPIFVEQHYYHLVK